MLNYLKSVEATGQSASKAALGGLAAVTLAAGMDGRARLRFADPAPGEVGVTVARQDDLLAQIEARLARGAGFAVATMNLDHIVKLRRDWAFRSAYLAQSHVVADGNPVVWLCRLAGRKVELVPGSDLIGPVAAMAARIGAPVGLVGATQAVLDRAAQRLEAAHPGLRVVSRVAPPMGFVPEGPGAEAVLDQVASEGARVVLLALGAPKQERVAALGRQRHPGLGFLSIGAGLDFIAGTQRRAPVWIRGLALEWLWRLVGNPWRLGGRYLACVVAMPGLAAAALAERRRG
jgi:N-acetylglucosaminyldiphosphoundecaprenol N-acetyl-beta-D-mannosaminyltransferase